MKELTIEKLSHDLRGIAHCDDSVWLVDGALPHERVLVQERARYSHRVEAEIVELIQTSAERVQPACEYAAVCGGCDVQHMDNEMQLSNKQQVLKEQVARATGDNGVQWLSVIADKPWAYRRRTKIACRWLGDKKQLVVGFRQRHSQAIVEINHCAVLVPALQKLLQPLRQCLVRWSQPRQLGHIELLAAENGVGMLLRVTSAINERDSVLLQDFAEQNEITVYAQTEDKKTAQFYCGVEKNLQISDVASGEAITCMPGDFLQANAAVNALLVAAVMQALEPSSTDNILEAFCGLGNFTLPLAKQVGTVVALELGEAMILRAERRAQEQGVANICWSVCDLSLQKQCEKSWLPDVNKVLLDPPRDGAQAFCQYAKLDGVERIVYVSCNPTTFARDAKILERRGFGLSQVGMADMFPQTSHIEVLAVFDVQPKVARKKSINSLVPNKKTLKKLKR